MNDKEIVELLWSRSESALGLIEQAYGKRCMSIAENIVSNPSDAEECVNDMYLSIWNTIPPKRPGSLMAYAFRIVRNIAIKKHRYNHAEKRDESSTLPIDELYSFLSDAEDNGESADRLRGLIEAFLDSLDQKNRVLFVRHYWFSDSARELSKKTGLSENNIYQRLFATREKLRKYLRQEGINV